MNKNHKFQSQGIEFSEAKSKRQVTIFDILEEIPNPEQIFWSIRYIDTQGYKGNLSLLKDIESANSQGIGYELRWADLVSFFKGVDSFIWLILIGVRDEKSLKNYQSDLERYENTNYNIEVFDGYIWDVFSLDQKFIDKLRQKFINTNPISPDETANWQRY